MPIFVEEERPPFEGWSVSDELEVEVAVAGLEPFK